MLKRPSLSVESNFSLGVYTQLAIRSSMSDDMHFKPGRWGLVGGIVCFSLGTIFVVFTEQPAFFLLMFVGVYLGYRVDRHQLIKKKDKELSRKQIENR